MFLPWAQHSAKIPEYSQISFSGINRNKASSDGSIYDMKNISTDDFPILSTTPNRKYDNSKYDMPWYYGSAMKEFVIAGKTLGKSYPIWESRTAYAKNDIVAYGGILYIVVKEVKSDNITPPSTSESFDIYTETTFSYDGIWDVNGTFESDSVWYYNGNFYRNLTGENRTLESDENWEKVKIESYKGEYAHSKPYYSGDIVYYSNNFYEHLEYGSGSDEHYPSNEKYWKLSDIAVWNPDVEYSENSVVYDTQSESFYKHLNTGKTITPDVDTSNWEPYSFSKLYYDGEEVIGLELIPCKKECSYLNGYIVIIPDNMYYHIDDGEYGYLSGTKSGKLDTTDYHKGIYVNGNYYDYDLKAGITDSNYTDDSGGTIPGTMNVIRLGFMGSSGKTFMDIDKYSNLNLTKIFRDGDVITISQVQKKENKNFIVIKNGSYVVQKVEPSKLIFNTGSFSGAYIGEDSMISNNPSLYYMGDVILSKGLPEMDFLCVSNNRMWGCKDDYVYGSALGDVFSWQRYSGLETDPVQIESSDIGSFSGCIEYGGYPLFFKENEIYRVYGSTASTFSLQKVADYGLRKDSPHAICIADSVLYFLSPYGVCAYTGGVPTVISGQLKTHLTNGYSGTDGRKVYISAEENKKRILYVYDTQNRIWSSEDFDTLPLGMENFNGELVSMDSKGNLVSVSKPRLDWQNEGYTHNAYIEFNDFYDDSFYEKNVGGIVIRASVEPEYDALEIYVQYDSDGEWHKVGSIYNQDNRKKVSEFRFFPMKCDHYKIRLECNGKFTLYGISRQTEQ